MAQGLEEIAELPDPVGDVMAAWMRPNGLTIERVRVPLGVIGMIYESRPNVTADAGGLCLKAGNAVILRGGSDGMNSSRAIHAALVAGLRQAGLDEAAIQIVDSADRERGGHDARRARWRDRRDRAARRQKPCGPRPARGAGACLRASRRHLPCLCSQRGRSRHGEDIAVNAKMRRTGVCGAAETLLVDEACAATHLAPLIRALIEAGCEVRGDAAARAADPSRQTASEEDWSTEYLDAIIAVKTVPGLDAAIAHIARYGSQHTDAIVTQDKAAATRFLREVDSAIVLHNASTQYADGGEFGMGAEIGIATGKFHARGPVGVEQLTSFKYCVYGAGQVRPV